MPGQYEEASMLFRIVIDKDSDNAIPRFLLGSSLQNLKKWKEAITEYKVVGCQQCKYLQGAC